MKCECGGDTLTKDSRKIDAGVWRKRQCVTCSAVFTTLEQRCTTLANPYSTKRHHKPDLVVPDVPKIQRPNPEKKRARPLRPGDEVVPAKPRGRKPLVQKAAPRPADVPVDRNEPSARDRIEDMKFEREFSCDHGWDTK